MGWIEKAASSFFTPTSQKKPERLVWRVVSNSLVVGRYSAEPDGERKHDGAKPRVAAFDLVRFVFWGEILSGKHG